MERNWPCTLRTRISFSEKARRASRGGGSAPGGPVDGGLGSRQAVGGEGSTGQWEEVARCRSAVMLLITSVAYCAVGMGGSRKYPREGLLTIMVTHCLLLPRGVATGGS